VSPTGGRARCPSGPSTRGETDGCRGPSRSIKIGRGEVRGDPRGSEPFDQDQMGGGLRGSEGVQAVRSRSDGGNQTGGNRRARSGVAPLRGGEVTGVEADAS
jgi:hypothetical protein